MEINQNCLSNYESNGDEKWATKEKTVDDEDDIDGNENFDDPDNNIPLAAVLDNAQNTFSDKNTNLPHHYQWRKMDTMHGDNTFVQSFSDPPDEKRRALQYFGEFIADKILETGEWNKHLHYTKKWQILKYKYGRSIIFYGHKSDNVNRKTTIL